MQPFLENTDRRSQNDGRSPVGENDYIHQCSHTTMHMTIFDSIIQVLLYHITFNFNVFRFSNFFWTGFNVVNNV